MTATRPRDARSTFEVLDPLLNLPSCFLQGTFYLQQAKQYVCAGLWSNILYLIVSQPNTSHQGRTIILPDKVEALWRVGGLDIVRNHLRRLGGASHIMYALRTTCKMGACLCLYPTYLLNGLARSMTAVQGRAEAFMALAASYMVL